MAASSVTSRSKLAIVSTLKFSAVIRSRSCRIWEFSTSTIAATLRNLWKGIGIVGVLILRSDVSAVLRSVFLTKAERPVVVAAVMSATFSERVANEHHPVIKRARPVKGLLDGLVWICVRADEAQSEVLVELPIDVSVQLK